MNKYPTFNNQSFVKSTTGNNQQNVSKTTTQNNNINDNVVKQNQLNNNYQNDLSDVRSVVSSNYDEWDEESILSLSSNISSIENSTNQKNVRPQQYNRPNFEFNKSNDKQELETTQRSGVSIFKDKMPSNIDFGVDFIANPNHTKEDLNDNISVRSGTSSLYLNKNIQPNKVEQSVDEIIEDITTKTLNENNNQSNFFNEKSIHPSSNDENINQEMLKKNIEIKQQTNKNIGSNYHKYAELTPHEIFDKKEEILIELEKLEEKGIKSEKRFTIQSDLYEMERCYLRLKRRRDQDIAVKLMRKVLLTFVTGTEYMTEKFLSETIHLDGWSESVLMNIVDYDEVFEELYDKYSSKFAVSPEIKLLIMLVGSAFTFHMTKMLTGGFVKQSIPTPVFNSQPQTRTTNFETPKTQQQAKNPFINLFGVMSEPNKANENVKNDDLDDIINEIEGTKQLEIPNELSIENERTTNVLNEYLSDEDDESEESEFYDEIIENKPNTTNVTSNKSKTIYYDEILENEPSKTLVL